jgi:ABC-type glutathione transport system ATPase component
MPLTTIENQIDKVLAIYKLSGEFEMAAKKSAVIIITEVALANHQKSIPSIDAGGIAGGEKYIHEGKKVRRRKYRNF